MLEKDVPKVVQAVRQTQSRKVLFKLLTRIKVRSLAFVPLPLSHPLRYVVDHGGSCCTSSAHEVAWVQFDD
jgi:hypothetical protein